MGKRDQTSEELEDLRKAFGAMASFDIRPTSTNRETYGIYLRSTGTHIGTIKKGLGNHLFRTLGVLSDHARKRTLRNPPHPHKTASVRRTLALASPALPVATPIPISTPSSAPDARTAKPEA